MNDPTQTTGTIPAEGGDAAVQTPTTGTPQEGQSRDAESVGVENKQLRELLAQQKVKIEEANRVLAERQEAQSPAAPVSATREEDVVQKWLQTDDPAAEAYRRLEREIVLKGQLDTLPEPQRKETLQHFLKNQHRLGDMNAARAELDAPALKTEVEKLRQEVEQLRRSPDPDVLNAPPTHGRETTARGNEVKTIPREQWNAEMSQLDPFSRLAKQRELNEGRVRIRG